MKFFTFYGLSLCLLAALTVNNARAGTLQEQNDSDEVIQFGGIGVVITLDDYGLRITGVLDGTPAAAAELFAGDYIWAVDGNETETWDLAQAVEAIRGDIGSTVTITIRRSGVELTVPLIRQLVSYPS